MFIFLMKHCNINHILPQLSSSPRDIRKVISQQITDTYLVKIDIKNAFESIDAINSIQLLKAHLITQYEFKPLIDPIIDHPNFLKFISHNGIAPIGYPTSNILFELAMIALDKEFRDFKIPEAFIKPSLDPNAIFYIKNRISYFRYVDDLTFIVPKDSLKVIGILKSIVEEHGFVINKHKIKVINFKSGWKVFNLSITKGDINFQYNIPKKVRNLVKTLIYNFVKIPLLPEFKDQESKLKSRIVGILGYYWPKTKPDDILKMAVNSIKNW